MPEDAQDPPRSVALALAPRGSSLELATPAWAIAQRIAGTEFVPAAYRGKPETVLAAFLTAHELGVAPMQALQKIHVIQGRPALAAELMRGLVLQHGHELWIEESTSTRCIIAGQRKGSDRISRVTWTLDDAKRANLTGKDNWKHYPAAMLLSRASSALCRMIFPDVLAGLSYTPEEIEDGDLPELGAEWAPPTEEDSPAARAAEPPRERARARRPATRGAEAPADTDAPMAEKPTREAPPLPGEDGPSNEVEEQEPDDDEPVDAVIVGDDGEPVGEGVGPVGDDDYEGPDQHLEGEGPGPSYSGPQIVSMKANDFGLNRDEKIFFVSWIVGRAITSTNELSAEETTKVLELFDQEDRLEEAWSEALKAGPVAPDPEPEVEEPKRTRRPLAGPESWDAPRWREFLRERGVKVAEVLAEGSRLAREHDTPTPTKLDEISESGLAAILVGFVEERAAERKGS